MTLSSAASFSAKTGLCCVREIRDQLGDGSRVFRYVRAWVENGHVEFDPAPTSEDLSADDWSPCGPIARRK